MKTFNYYLSSSTLTLENMIDLVGIDIDHIDEMSDDVNVLT